MPTKVIGWGKCSAVHTPSGTGATAVTYTDIVEGSTSLSVEEGQDMEALIEGGSAEARKKQPDKYIIEFERRIGDASEATPGFTEDAGTIKIDPELVGAIGVTLSGVSLYVTVSFDSTDGLKAKYQFKTKGATTAGALTDITFAAKSS